MRTIRIYKIGKDTWLSPSELWQAVNSGEDVTIMAHSAGVNIPKALAQAAKHIKFAWKTSILAAVSGGLWSLCVAALVTWPIIGALMLSEIKIAIQLIGVLGAVVCSGLILYGIRGYRKIHNTLFDFPIIPGQELPAPVDALRQPKYRLPKLTLPIAVTIAAIVLNSIVVATPLAPAVVWADPSYVTKSVVVVPPFTKWEQRSHYPPGESITYFASIDGGEKYWVVYMEYYVYRADILEELGDWDAWLDMALRWVVDQDTQQLRLQLEPGLTIDEQTTRLVEIVSNPERLQQLEYLMMEIFAGRYPALALRGITLEVKLMTVSQLQSALRRQS